MDGLRKARAILWRAAPVVVEKGTVYDRPNMNTRPAYLKGFKEGLKEGSEIINGERNMV